MAEDAWYSAVEEVRGASSFQTRSKAVLNPDRPIERQEDDKLSRWPLVEGLGKILLAQPSPPSSFVVALNAPWGAGKTSFLNLLEWHLSDADNAPIVVRFNPWLYNSIEQLVGMFFGHLAAALETKNPGYYGKEIGKALRIIGGVVGAVPGGEVFGAGMKGLGEIFGRETSLEEAKVKIGQKLTEFGNRVVIFIDDIDRLEPNTIRLLFKLIRLTADFDNTTYVLAFDRQVVELALTDKGISGHDYLEKIVQVPVDLPVPERTQIYDVLIAELRSISEALPVRAFDSNRWNHLFNAGFKDHFTTMRQVWRYTNSLKITLTPIACEVDLIDFLGIELIRVFHPDIYRG